MADWVVFVIGALMTLLGAAGMLTVKNPVHSALLLVQTLFGVAVLFVAQQAHFLAAVQVIVYAGAIVVLFLFVIMLIGVDRSDTVAPETIKGQRAGAAIVGALVLVELLAIGRVNFTLGASKGPAAVAEATQRSNAAGAQLDQIQQSIDASAVDPQQAQAQQRQILVAKTVADEEAKLAAIGSTEGDGTNVEQLSEAVFTRYLFAFEVTSVLLVIAVVGAVLLARKPRALDASKKLDATTAGGAA
jgi:NADH-quinone oxidoreductase subunit J